MSWRIFFPEDQSEDVNFADGVVLTREDVKKVAQEYRWMLPHKLFAPSLNDERLRAYILECDEKYGFEPEDYTVFVRCDTEPTRWRQCRDTEVRSRRTHE